MEKRPTKSQIEESLAKWANYLIESGEATFEEVEASIGEGLLKSLGSKIKDGLASAGSAVKDAVAGAGEKIHDAFLKNKGVAMFLDKVKEAKEKVDDVDALKLVAIIGGAQYPIVDLSIPKKFKKTLVLNINPENKDFKNSITIGTLKEAIKAAGIKKMSAGIDGIVCGQAQPAAVAEAEEDLEEAAKKKAAAPKKVEPDVPNFKEEPVETTSGDKIQIADENKLLGVKFDGKAFIAFEFDKSKEVKAAEKAEDDILS